MGGALRKFRRVSVRVRTLEPKDAIAARDHYDSNRVDSPLTTADGSVVVDTTGLGIDEVLAKIEALI